MMMAPLRIFIFSVFMTFLTLAPLAEADSHNNQLKPLVGTWQVKGVRLDVTLTRTPSYNYDDHRLVGRLISITNNEITTDMPENTSCSEPRATVASSTLDALVQQSMGRSKNGAIQQSSRFELPLDGRKELQVWWVACRKGDAGPDTPYGPEGENWVAKLADDQLAVRWYDNTILLLHRLPPNQIAHPSFDCKRVKSASEKAICSSLSLSEFDQSVSQSFLEKAKAYQSTGEFAQLKMLQGEQKAWLVRRNKCAGDKACLRKSMEERLEELSRAN